MEIRINERAEIERTFIYEVDPEELKDWLSDEITEENILEFLTDKEAYDIDEDENTLETEVEGLDSIVEELNNY